MRLSLFTIFWCQGFSFSEDENNDIVSFDMKIFCHFSSVAAFCSWLEAVMFQVTWCFIPPRIHAPSSTQNHKLMLLWTQFQKNFSCLTKLQLKHQQSTKPSYETITCHWCRGTFSAATIFKRHFCTMHVRFHHNRIKNIFVMQLLKL